MRRWLWTTPEDRVAHALLVHLMLEIVRMLDLNPPVLRWEMFRRKVVRGGVEQTWRCTRMKTGVILECVT